MADQIFENCQNVLAVANHAFEQRTKARLAFRFAVPFGEHRGRHFNIAAKFFGGMTSQKKPVEKSGFALRELKILRRLFDRSWLRDHDRKPQFTDFGAGVKRTGCIKVYERRRCVKCKSKARMAWRLHRRTAIHMPNYAARRQIQKISEFCPRSRFSLLQMRFILNLCDLQLCATFCTSLCFLYIAGNAARLGTCAALTMNALPYSTPRGSGTRAPLFLLPSRRRMFRNKGQIFL